MAADASPHVGLAVVTSTGGGRYTISAGGGTSASAPLWAGLIALADRVRRSPFGLCGFGHLPHRPKRQVSQGISRRHHRQQHSEVPPKTFTGYTATSGWDPVTGWGSPDAAVLVPLLARDTHPNDAEGL